MSSFVHTSFVLDGSEKIGESGDGQGRSLVLTVGDSIAFILPPFDDAAELFIDGMAAALGNLASKVQLRRQERARAGAGEEVVGWNGAGADVEAQRG